MNISGNAWADDSTWTSIMARVWDGQRDARAPWAVLDTMTPLDMTETCDSAYWLT